MVKVAEERGHLIPLKTTYRVFSEFFVIPRQMIPPTKKAELRTLMTDRGPVDRR